MIGQPLAVRLGSGLFPADSAGCFLRLKGPMGDVLQTARVDHWEGGIANWRRVGVLGGTRDRARFFVLEPGDRDDALVFEDFYVKGRFRVVFREGDTHRAREAYRTFAAA